jgi:hypothetical protein
MAKKVGSDIVREYPVPWSWSVKEGFKAANGNCIHELACTDPNLADTILDCVNEASAIEDIGYKAAKYMLTSEQTLGEKIDAMVSMAKWFRQRSLRVVELYLAIDCGFDQQFVQKFLDKYGEDIVMRAVQTGNGKFLSHEDLLMETKRRIEGDVTMIMEDET